MNQDRDLGIFLWYRLYCLDILNWLNIQVDNWAVRRNKREGKSTMVIHWSPDIEKTDRMAMDYMGRDIHLVLAELELEI